MKKLPVLFLLALSLSSRAQNHNKFCGHGEAMEELFKTDPTARLRIEQMNEELKKADEEAYKNGYDKYKNGYFSNTEQNRTNNINNTQGVVYTIPVVFHILHENGVEKITPTQVQDAIRILNIDYNKRNEDTTEVINEFKNLIGNAEINFVLATRDPSGNYTNGIVYHQSSMTDWTSGTAGPYTGTSAGKWSPTKYLNIYSVKSISSGAAGYTYLPGSWSTGSGNDCIIILHNYIGAIGTGNVNQSRALTHEVGHWLNLPHVWGGNNTPGTACGNEGVSDTPVTKGYDYCPSDATASMICNPGIAENYQNYMDYSYCSYMFTQGQVTRMRTAITSSISGRNNLWSATNLNNTGVTNPLVGIPNAFFNTVSNIKNICEGGMVTFKDSTWNTTVTGWNWSFPGGTPSASNDSMPTVTYSAVGVYPVSYTATTSAGAGTYSRNDFISVGENTADVQTPLVEGFEFITFPDANWVIQNDGGGVTWTQDNTTGATGTNCIKLENFNNSANQTEVFYTPSYNISNINTSTPTASFTFKLAYQRVSTSASEKLQVYSSTNCGQTWNLRYSKAGATLATITAANTSAFVPTSATDWRTETVSISALMAQQNVWFKFVFTSDANGLNNNLYIDNINLSNNVVGLKATEENTLPYTIYPNPNNGEMNASFNLQSTKSVKLELINVLGKTVETAIDKKLNAGEYNFRIGNNTSISTGIYFSKLTIDGKCYIQKIIIE